MQSEKAAGPDSFPDTFYKRFSDKFVPLLHVMYTEYFLTETLLQLCFMPLFHFAKKKGQRSPVLLFFLAS